MLLRHEIHQQNTASRYLSIVKGAAYQHSTPFTFLVRLLLFSADSSLLPEDRYVSDEISTFLYIRQLYSPAAFLHLMIRSYGPKVDVRRKTKPRVPTTRLDWEVIITGRYDRHFSPLPSSIYAILIIHARNTSNYSHLPCCLGKYL